MRSRGPCPKSRFLWRLHLHQRAALRQSASTQGLAWDRASQQLAFSVWYVAERHSFVGGSLGHAEKPCKPSQQHQQRPPSKPPSPPASPFHCPPVQFLIFFCACFFFPLPSLARCRKDLKDVGGRAQETVSQSESGKQTPHRWLAASPVARLTFFFYLISRLSRWKPTVWGLSGLKYAVFWGIPNAWHAR